MLQQECGGQNVGVADDQNDCCAIGGAGGALARFGLFDFCFECSPRECSIYVYTHCRSVSGLMPL